MARKKLSEAARQAKHARRMAGHRRGARHRGRRRRYEEAMYAYLYAVSSGQVAIIAMLRQMDLQRVVCERCGLEQEYMNADNVDADFVYPCPGPLDMGCGHEYCISSEHYAELVEAQALHEVPA